MKLTILQEKLKEGLAIVERISAKSLTLPILNNILVSVEKNFLNLAATDLEVGINWWGLAKIEKSGKITIPSRVFSNFINLLPNKKIELELKNNNLSIVCENYKTQIKGLSAEDFPIIPEISDSESIFINSSLFCQSLSQIVDIPVPSTTRPEISGVYFLFQKDLIIMAATDSFRLGEKKIFIKNSFSLKKDSSFILPQKSAKEIINIFGAKDGDLKIYFSSNQVMFESPMAETSHPQIRVISRIIEGEYPNYKEIVPQQFTTQAAVDKNEFLNQIKISSLFSGKANEIKMKVDVGKKEIELFSQSQEIGEYQSSIPAKIKGEGLEVVFNHRFVLEGVSNVKSSEVEFELSGDSGPGVIKPVGDQTYLYVVMPIKAG